MSLLVELIRLIPPSFRTGYCPANLQQFANDLINGTQATFLIQQGNFLYNFGNVTPTPENRIYPWLNTDDGLWWIFQSGIWTSPNPVPPGPSGLRHLWVGTNDGAAGGLWTYNGGDGTDPGSVAPQPTTGSMWEVDAGFAGRFPIGVGAIPDTSPAASIVAPTNVLDSIGNKGEPSVILTPDQIQHMHGVGTDGNVMPDGTIPGADDDPPVMLSRPWSTPAINYKERYCDQNPSNSGGWKDGPDINHGTMGTSKALTDTNETNFGHNNMPPFYGTFFIKRTARVYFTRPA